MTSSRLPLLVLFALALLGARWATWPRAGQGAADLVPVAQRAQRPTSEDRVAVTDVPAALRPSDDVFAATRDPEPNEPRNAFAVRQAPVPRPAATPKPVDAPKVAAFVGPPAPPPVPPPPPTLPPAPPPVQVIGAWKDAAGTSLFLVGPQGVLQARTGDTVLSDWRIEAITPNAVLLRQASTQRDAQLPLPESTRAALLAGNANK